MAAIGYTPIADPTDPKGKRRTICVDEKRGPLITEAFKIYASGKHSLASLVEVMNRNGLSTRPTLLWPESGHGPRPMTKPLMFKILRNPLYTGTIKWRGNIYQGKHEPLVTRQMFNRVQAVLKAHCQYVKPETKKQFLFRGVATCGERDCWARMTASEQSGAHNSGRYVYYYCRAKGCSNHKAYKEGFVARVVEEALGDMFIDDALAARIKAHLKSASDEQGAAEQAALAKLSSEHSRLTANSKALLQALLDGTVTRAQYQEKVAEIDEAVERVKRERERLTKTNHQFREEGALLIDLLRGVKAQYMAATPERKAAIIQVLVDKVVLRPNESYVSFREPFGSLIGLKKVLPEASWGE